MTSGRNMQKKSLDIRIVALIASVLNSAMFHLPFFSVCGVGLDAIVS